MEAQQAQHSYENTSKNVWKIRGRKVFGLLKKIKEFAQLVLFIVAVIILLNVLTIGFIEITGEFHTGLACTLGLAMAFTLALY